MKKLFVALVLVAAFCMIAVSPVVADANENPANLGINSSNPFWFPDYVPSSGKTLDAVFKAPAYTPSSGKTLDAVFTRPEYRFSSGGIFSAAYKFPWEY